MSLFSSMPRMHSESSIGSWAPREHLPNKLTDSFSETRRSVPKNTDPDSHQFLRIHFPPHDSVRLDGFVRIERPGLRGGSVMKKEMPTRVTMVRSITKYPASTPTGDFRGSISVSCATGHPARSPMMNTKKIQSPTLLSGKRDATKMATTTGKVPGARADPAGTSSAPRCAASTLERISIYTRVELTSFFLTTKTRSRRAKPALEPAWPTTGFT